MQLKINQRLNQILIIMLLTNLPIIAYLVFFNYSLLQENLLTVAIILFLYNSAWSLLFKMLEINWDKRMIQKMAINKQVAIANITKAEKYTALKDSSGHHYNIWQFNVIYWDQEMKAHEGVLFDKLNPSVEEVPLGTVYITFDPTKPLRKFILQNIIVGNIPSLQPLVTKYENNKTINIKYLNVYYNKGLVIETFKQSLKASKEASS